VKPQVINEEWINGIVDTRRPERRIEFEALFLPEDDLSLAKAMQN
jgi:hypothetical protein